MSSFTLKIIAIATMLIDHIGFLGESILGVNHPAAIVFRIMRCVGRISMPLFIFMIAEGCTHTRDIKKYMRSLFIFAIISEIPFDIFVNSAHQITQNSPPKLYTFGMQNVFFTLLIGVIAVFLYQKILTTKLKWLAFLPVIPLMLLAEVMNTDYGWIGVLGIFIVYIMPNKYLKLLALTAVITASILGKPIEMAVGFVSVLLVLLYNGKRGYNIKWFFYWFYPIHISCLSMLVTFYGRFI